MDNIPATHNNPYQAPQAAIEYALPPDEFELAERGTRFGAAIVEGLIPVTIAVVFFFFIGGLSLASGFSGYSADSDIRAIAGIGLGALCLIVLLIVNIYLLYKNGQTISKYLFGIKIVRTDGSRAGVWRILLLRGFVMGLIQQIPIVGIIIMILDPLLIFRDSRKCLHDDIADTIVIKA